MGGGGGGEGGVISDAKEEKKLPPEQVKFLTDLKKQERLHVMGGLGGASNLPLVKLPLLKKGLQSKKQNKTIRTPISK